MFARTVTRQVAFSWIPSLAMAAMSGVSMTFGLTLIFTASSTSRPARSIAVARWKLSSMLALSADMRARITASTLPPAR